MGEHKFRDGVTVSVDDLTVRDDALVTGDLVVQGSTMCGDGSSDTHVFSGSLTLDGLPAIGGHVTLRAYDSGVTALNTGGATTTLTMGIPAGAVILSAQAKVTTAVAGSDATTGTFALTGGSTETLGTISAFTLNTKMTVGVGAKVTNNTAQASFALSGGSDQTPSAGAVRLVVYALVANALD